MKVYSDRRFCDFFRATMENLRDPQIAKEYYHTLYPDDAKPVVVHGRTAQCTLVLSGHGIVTLDQTDHPIRTDDVILIDAGVSHQFTAEEPLVLFHIHIPAETSESDRTIIVGDDFVHHFL